MSDQNPNRVLSRTGARELTENEMREVNGAVGTQTAVCTVVQKSADGDVRDC